MPFLSKIFLFYIEIEKKEPKKILVEEIKTRVFCDIYMALPHRMTVAL